ncbi:hypothetical protein HGB07_03810 [Candidatus Roizmanbacteria bacterium]|nr:hypothetical protein [Candidatus Roizmanbacteria bacterium]
MRKWTRERDELHLYRYRGEESYLRVHRLRDRERANRTAWRDDRTDAEFRAAPGSGGSHPGFFHCSLEAAPSIDESDER